MHSMVYDVSELLAAPDVLLYPIHTKAENYVFKVAKHGFDLFFFYQKLLKPMFERIENTRERLIECYGKLSFSVLCFWF